MREERGDLDLPVLDEAFERIEDVFDRLCREALGPSGTKRELPLLRALTDIPVWRSLRARGVAGDDAIDVAATAIEAVLARSPRRSR